MEAQYCSNGYPRFLSDPHNSLIRVLRVDEWAEKTDREMLDIFSKQNILVLGYAYNPANRLLPDIKGIPNANFDMSIATRIFGNVKRDLLIQGTEVSFTLAWPLLTLLSQTYPSILEARVMASVGAMAPSLAFTTLPFNPVLEGKV